MSKRMICGLIVALLAGTAIANHALHAQGPQPNAPMATRFAGKAILVLARDGIAETLADSEVKTIGGRAFVTGVSVKDSNLTRSQFGGNKIWIPLESVTQIVEFENLDQFKK